MKGIRADISEIFSSMQGEGIFVGAKQIFVRFKECNLRCSFCDEPRIAPGLGYSPSELVNAIVYLEKKKGPHHSVSLTGGEPLLYAGFLLPALKLLKETERLGIYLETNGTLPEGLSKIIDHVDIVAMDFKLPSSTGEKDYWARHTDFLKIAKRKDVFVKIVVTPQTTEVDIRKAIALVKKVDRRIPLVLQPVTATRAYAGRAASGALTRFSRLAFKNDLRDVRVIPQVHKMLGVR